MGTAKSLARCKGRLACNALRCPLRLGALVASAQALRLQAGPGDRDTDFSGICAGGGFHTVSTLAVKQRRHATLL